MASEEKHWNIYLSKEIFFPIDSLSYIGHRSQTPVSNFQSVATVPYYRVG